MGDAYAAAGTGVARTGSCAGVGVASACGCVGAAAVAVPSVAVVSGSVLSASNGV